jgi:hypothetical protein
MAPLVRCRFPKYAVDHLTRTPSREDGERNCAPAFLPPDTRIVTCAPVLLAGFAERRPEQDTEERHTDRGAHMRCGAGWAGYRIRQSGHGGAAEAG